MVGLRSNNIQVMFAKSLLSKEYLAIKRRVVLSDRVTKQ